MISRGIPDIGRLGEVIRRNVTLRHEWVSRVLSVGELGDSPGAPVFFNIFRTNILRTIILRIVATGDSTHTKVSQPWVSSPSPVVTREEPVLDLLRVTGPRDPPPTVMRSMDRTGVTSTALPTKKTSSAM